MTLSVHGISSLGLSAHSNTELKWSAGIRCRSPSVRIFCFEINYPIGRLFIVSQFMPNPSPSIPYLSAIAVEKIYLKGQHKIPVLRGVDFHIRRGELVSIVGQSGSGKSTLLHLMGLLDKPTVGEIHIEGSRVDDLPDATRDELRNRVFGFIFQF